ncbi:MAG: LuxR family transcriptional regulator [Rhodobacteraceae bacterium]|nr:LuxR family transcriptional regulator [Paracoccaceae bacterium]
MQLNLKPQAVERRSMLDCERYTPEALQDFLLDMEATTTSRQVWDRLVKLGKGMGMPFVDFIVATSYQNWRKTLFIRTSYDSTWLNELNKDPEIHKWSYFRSHAINYLTPITIGLEYIDEYRHVPAKRVQVMRKAASIGLRAGFSIPLRTFAPPQAGLITFGGDYSKREFDRLIQVHGWTLNAAAMVAHQRYMTHFVAEFPERNRISEKQRDLLELIGLGLQDKQIADTFQISISAVRQRMNKLMEKTGLTTRPELAALAMSIGVLPDPLNRPHGPTHDFLIEMG